MAYADEDRRILSLLAATRQTDFNVIYDIGGSNGGWARAALSVFPQAGIHCFEPAWAISDFYDEKRDGFLRDFPAAQLHAFAIGDHEGEIEFHFTPDGVSSTTLEWAAAATLATTKKVPVRTIDSIVRNGDAPQPDLIKMDIQGGELNALRGAVETLPKAKALFLETWFQRSYGEKTPLLAEIVTFLAPYGFLPFDFGDYFRDDKGVAYAVDACFVRD